MKSPHIVAAIQWPPIPSSVDVKWPHVVIGGRPLWQQSADVLKIHTNASCVVHFNAPRAVEAEHTLPRLAFRRRNRVKTFTDALSYWDATTIVVASPCYALRGAPLADVVLRVMHDNSWSSCLAESYYTELLLEVYDRELLAYLGANPGIDDPALVLRLGVRSGAFTDTPFERCIGIIEPARSHTIVNGYRSLELHRVDTAELFEKLAADMPDGSSWCDLPQQLTDAVLATAREVRQARFTSHRNATPLTPGRRRILFVSSGSALSGAEESLCQLGRGLDQLGFATGLVLPFGGEFARRARLASIEVFELGVELNGMSLVAARKFERVVTSWLPDILHVNGDGGLLPVESAYRHALPALQHARAWNTDSLREFSMYYDAMLAPSHALADRLRQTLHLTGEVFIAYDGTDPSYYCPDRALRSHCRSELRAADNDVVVLCVARLDRTKQQDVLLKAAARVRAAGEPIKLVLVGESFDGSDYATELGELIDSVNETSWVSLFRYASDVRPLINAADICALPSCDEPLGTFVLESMALGRPVMVSAGGGLAEIVDTSYGIVAASGDIDIWAEGLCRLARSPRIRREMGVTARDRVVASFSHTAHASCVAECYALLNG